MPSARAWNTRQFTCAHATHFINGSFANVPASQKLTGETPRLHMNSEDAAARALDTGALCRVFNERGDCFLTLDVTDAIGPGVVVADAVWWPRDHVGGRNINSLLSDELTDVGNAPRYQEALVQVEAGSAPG